MGSKYKDFTDFNEAEKEAYQVLILEYRDRLHYLQDYSCTQRRMAEILAPVLAEELRKVKEELKQVNEEVPFSDTVAKLQKEEIESLKAENERYKKVFSILDDKGKEGLLSVGEELISLTQQLEEVKKDRDFAKHDIIVGDKNLDNRREQIKSLTTQLTKLKAENERLHKQLNYDADAGGRLSDAT